MTCSVYSARFFIGVFLAVVMMTCQKDLLVSPSANFSDRLSLRTPNWKVISLIQSPAGQNDAHYVKNKGKPLWRKNDLLLFGEWDYELKNKEHILVMVSFDAALKFNQAYRPLARALAHDQRTQLYYPGDEEHQGFALISVESSEELTTLAADAHGVGGLPCGQVEILDLNQSLLALDTPVSPPYGETIPLSKVKSAITEVSGTNIKATIQSLQDLGSRQHNTTSGTNASTSVKTLFDNAASGLSGYTSELRSHGTTATTQKSVIAAVAGTTDNTTTIVVGAHLDSINRADSSQAPGADDDASGIATLVETLRVIIASKMTFKRKIEFHAYAAEEVGLVGSAEIAASYRSQSRKVAAMLQLDMNAYSKDGSSKTIFFVTNDTSTVLRKATTDLLDTYLGGDYQEVSLAAGTSDHKSWNNNGFNAVFPFEHPTEYNRSIHSATDTVSTINNVALSERFTKLLVAFIAHQAGLVESESEYSAALTSIFSKTDMGLAILPAQTADTYTLAVGTTTDIQRVESCLVSGPTESVCLGTRTSFTQTSTGGERNLFAGGTASAGISLAVGSYVRFLGWGKDSALLAQRTVLLSAK